MNKKSKHLFSKNIFLCTCLLTCAFSGCSEKNPVASSPLPPAETAPTINNLWTPDQPIWTPHYQLPADWQINLDSPESSRSTDDSGWPDELKVFYLGPADQNPAPATLRDQLYQQIYCDGEKSQTTINCSKGFTKTSTIIAGFPAEILRYYGTWQNENREVNEIFINRDGEILHFTAEGDFQKILSALKSLLETIEWKKEKSPSGPSQQPEEIGL